MTASGDFLSKDLFCQPQQPDLLIRRPLKDVFQSFSCLFHHFLPFSTKTPFIFRSYFRLEPARKYAYTVNIRFLRSDTNATFVLSRNTWCLLSILAFRNVCSQTIRLALAQARLPASFDVACYPYRSFTFRCQSSGHGGYVYFLASFIPEKFQDCGKSLYYWQRV